MSYLTSQSPTGIGSKNIVISFWFRIPKQSLDLVAQEFKAWKAATDAAGDAGVAGPPRRPLLGIIPLMTFGPAKLKARKFYFPTREVGEVTNEDWRWTDGSGVPDCVGARWLVEKSETLPLSTNYWSFEKGNDTTGGAGGGFDLDGSYIGVDCTEDSPAFSINIVMPATNLATMKGSWPNVISQTFSGPVVSVFGNGLCPGAPGMHFDPVYGLCHDSVHASWVNTLTYKGDADVIYGCVPETFRLLPAKSDSKLGVTSNDAADENFKGVQISPDHWHHVLLALDFNHEVKSEGQLVHDASEAAPPSTAGTRVKGGVKIGLALDDRHITGRQLSAYYFGDNPKDITITSINALNIASDVNTAGTYPASESTLCRGVDPTVVEVKQLPTYSFTPDNISFNPLGLPADADRGDAVRRVEMGELQIFTDVKLDLSDLPNRRAFVDDKGKPTATTKKKDPEDPKSFSGSIELLRKEPEILLHTSTNWMKGKNTGSSETEFEPKGKNLRYRPDPSLSGDQGVKEKPKP